MPSMTRENGSQREFWGTSLRAVASIETIHSCGERYRAPGSRHNRRPRKLCDGLRTDRSKELSFMKSAIFSPRGKSNVVDLLTGGSFMKSIGPDRKSARFSKFNYILQAATPVVIGGLFIAARFIFGGQQPTAGPQIAGDPGVVERYLTHVATDKPIYRTG